MMLYQSGRGIDPGKLRVRTNPGDNGREFAVVEITDRDAIFINTPEEADALIAAAVEAKRLLDPPVPAGPGGLLLPADCDPDNAPEVTS